jgi:hypothetical protein
MDLLREPDLEVSEKPSGVGAQHGHDVASVSQGLDGLIVQFCVFTAIGFAIDVEGLLFARSLPSQKDGMVRTMSQKVFAQCPIGLEYEKR